MLRNILIAALLLVPFTASAQQLCKQRVVEVCSPSGISCQLVVVCD